MAPAEKIPLEAVQSSNIAAVGYRPDWQVLAVKFVSGAIYHYAGVSLEMALQFYGSESKGRFYAHNVRGKLSAQKMTADCPQCGDKDGWIGEVCSDCGTAVYTEKPRT